MLVDKTTFMMKEVSRMSTSMAAMAYQLKNQEYASSYVHEQEFF